MDTSEVLPVSNTETDWWSAAPPTTPYGVWACVYASATNRVVIVSCEINILYVCVGKRNGLHENILRIDILICLCMCVCHTDCGILSVGHVCESWKAMRNSFVAFGLTAKGLSVEHTMGNVYTHTPFKLC